MDHDHCGCPPGFHDLTAYPFCLLEVTRQDGRGRPAWVATGSDATYTRIADQRFAEPLDALRAQLPETAGYRLTEADAES